MHFLPAAWAHAGADIQAEAAAAMAGMALVVGRPGAYQVRAGRLVGKPEKSSAR